LGAHAQIIHNSTTTLRTRKEIVMRALLDTRHDTTLFFQRIVLALVLGAHGVQKAFGWFGGFGFDGTMKFFTEALGVPALLALLIVLGETLGAVGLIAGAGTRIAAFGATATMLGAIALVHWPFGFYMNWGGTQGGEGFELHLFALGLSLPLLVRGGGAYALDGVLSRWIARRNEHSLPIVVTSGTSEA
jgi:putative oxidoreductase